MAKLGVYDNMADDFFLGLLDWELIRSIPRFINSKHVHLDATMTLLFKLILHFGWLLSTEDHPSNVAIILQGIYTDCKSLQIASKVEQPEPSFEALVIHISLVSITFWVVVVRANDWLGPGWASQIATIGVLIAITTKRANSLAT